VRNGKSDDPVLAAEAAAAFLASSASMFIRHASVNPDSGEKDRTLAAIAEAARVESSRLLSLFDGQPNGMLAAVAFVTMQIVASKLYRSFVQDMESQRPGAAKAVGLGMLHAAITVLRDRCNEIAKGRKPAIIAGGEAWIIEMPEE
jgi:uncharacterized membrane protein